MRLGRAMTTKTHTNERFRRLESSRASARLAGATAKMLTWLWMREIRLRRHWVLAASLMLTLLALPAMAGVNQEAAEHFARGVQLVESGQTQAGLAEFLKAYQLSPRYSVLYNIGLAQAELGWAAQAEQTLTQYLQAGGVSIPQARREQLQKQLLELADRIGELEIHVDVPEARVELDGTDLDSARLAVPMRIDAGEHTIKANGPGYEPAQQQVTIVARQRAVLTMNLQRTTQPGTLTSEARQPWPVEPGASPSPVSQGRTASGATPTQSRNTVPFDEHSSGTSGNVQRGIGVATGIVGLVGVAIGTGFAVRAHSRGQDADANCYPNRGITTPGACNSTGFTANSDAQHASTVSIVSFAVGGASLVSGLVLILTAPSNGSQHRVSRKFWDYVTVDPGAVSFGGQW